MPEKTALIVVDVQNDFCEGGSLAVEGGNDVAEGIASFIGKYGHEMFDEIVFTKDFHNPWPDTNGGHFAEEPDFVDSWPVHCVSSQEGSDIHPALTELAQDRPIFHKGMGKPCYSGFEGFLNPVTEETTLDEYLKSKDIKRLYVVGIAADYCVKATAVSGQELGYKVTIFPNMTVGIAKNGYEVASEINAL